jgi:hypothetical protein
LHIPATAHFCPIKPGKEKCHFSGSLGRLFRTVTLLYKFFSIFIGVLLGSSGGQIHLPHCLDQCFYLFRVWVVMLVDFMSWYGCNAVVSAKVNPIAVPIILKPLSSFF